MTHAALSLLLGEISGLDKVMADEQWWRVKAIFEAALEQPEESREGFLDRACGGEESLRSEVATLLNADREAADFMETSPAAGLWSRRQSTPMAPENAPETVLGPVPIGSSIGPYRLVKRLVDGGMSTVYLAVRADQEFRRRVAIKIIRQDLRSENIDRLLRTERQILAGLDHPYIAKMLDGGTVNGSPYLVMEYIEGVPIDRYCDQQGLSTDECIELFIKVCAAVHYAHQNQLVHRDIKPGNIMVRADGEPKLLDFGIAKLLNPELSSVDGDIQASALPAMTPRYASPEQLNGEPITPASDIYSLGLLLRQLLGEFLSAGSKASKWRPWLSRDLEHIVVKCTSPEPHKRYESVAQLASDLRKSRVDLPVHAHPPTGLYRAAKALRRHRSGLAISILMASMAGFLLLVLRNQSQQTELERHAVHQLTSFVTELMSFSDGAESVAVAELLDRGTETAQRQLADFPEIETDLMNTFATGYRSLGLHQQARSTVTAALETRRQIFDAAHPKVIESLYTLGWVHLGADELDDAERVFQQAWDLARPFSRDLHRHHGEISLGLGQVRAARGEHAEAEEYFRQSIDLFRRLESSPQPRLADALIFFGQSLASAGDFASALPLLEEAQDVQLQIVGHEHPRMIYPLVFRANILYWQGVYDQAEELYRQALAIQRRFLGTEQHEWAQNLANLGGLLFTTGRHDEAEEIFREAVAIQRKTEVGREHLAYTLNTLGLVLVAKGEPASAEELYREAMAIQRKRVGESHPQFAYSLNNLATLLLERGDLETAEPLFRKALEIWRDADDSRQVAAALQGLGRLLIDKGEAANAEPVLREAVAILTRLLPSNHWRIAQSEGLLGEGLAALGQFAEAESLLVPGYSVLRRERDPDSPEVQRALDSLVALYVAWRKPQKAARYRALQAEGTPALEALP